MTRETMERLADAAGDRRRAAVLQRLNLVGERGMTVDEIEQLIEEVALETSAADEQDLMDAQDEPELGNSCVCPTCERRSGRFKLNVEFEILTSHGYRTVQRRHYYCSACRKGFCPRDAVLGLEPGKKATRQVRAWIAKCGAKCESFAEVPEMLMDFRSLQVSESTVQRVTVEVGEAIAAANEATVREELGGDPMESSESTEAPSRVYLGMDGTSVPVRDAWKKDGSLGDLKCEYKEAKVGMAFTVAQNDEGMDCRITSRSCVATMQKIKGFLPLILLLAKRWDLYRARDLVILGDGAAWIWRLAKRLFPKALQILDFWHVTGYLKCVAFAMFGSLVQPEAVEWMDTQIKLLESDGVGKVIAAIRTWKPKRAEHTALRLNTIRYFQNNRARMRYGAYLAKGYYIGSGPIESLCKQLVQRRLHEAGMHWREGTAEAVLALWAHLQSTNVPSLRIYA